MRDAYHDNCIKEYQAARFVYSLGFEVSHARIQRDIITYVHFRY